MNIMKKLLHIGLIGLALSASLAFAQAEPSMSEIYAAAQAGQMDKAHALVQEVLVTHPHSAKAHYVQAELYAREGKTALARENLSEAERTAPGLPFAKPESVRALQAEIDGSGAARPLMAAPGHAPAPASSPIWPWLLLIAGGVIMLGYFLFRERRPVVMAQPYPGNPGAAVPMGGPQPYGGSPYGGSPYGYGPGYPQPAQPGIGSRIAGGVATGLAMGAGLAAGEAIGERLFGHEHNGGTPVVDNGNGYVPMDTNTDMGGNNFGVNDTSWDDGSSSSGSDWDN